MADLVANVEIEKLHEKIFDKKEKFHFEGRARVKALVFASIMCGCQCEGDLQIAVPKNIEKPGFYTENSPTIFKAFDGGWAFTKILPKEWIDGPLRISGEVTKASENKIIIKNDVGTPREDIEIIGQLRFKENKPFVDFNDFQCFINNFNRNSENLKEELQKKGFKDGDYLDLSDCTVYISVYYKGTKEEIVNNKAPIFVSYPPAVISTQYVIDTGKYTAYDSKKPRFKPEELVEKTWFKQIVSIFREGPTTLKELSEKTKLSIKELNEYLEEMRMFPVVEHRKLVGEDVIHLWLRANEVKVIYCTPNRDKIYEKTFII